MHFDRAGNPGDEMNAKLQSTAFDSITQQHTVMLPLPQSSFKLPVGVERKL